MELLENLLNRKPKRPNFRLEDIRKTGMESYNHEWDEYEKRLIEWTADAVAYLLAKSAR